LNTLLIFSFCVVRYQSLLNEDMSYLFPHACFGSPWHPRHGSKRFVFPHFPVFHFFLFLVLLLFCPILKTDDLCPRATQNICFPVLSFPFVSRTSFAPCGRYKSPFHFGTFPLFFSQFSGMGPFFPKLAHARFSLPAQSHTRRVRFPSLRSPLLFHHMRLLPLVVCPLSELMVRTHHLF